MQLRAAIRYSEYKHAGKLPSKIPESCAKCIEKEQQDINNCGGKGNPKYICKIGTMEFYQCPPSIPDKDTWDVIELILTQEESKIPIVGTCLLDQTPKMFEFRRYILSERYDCFKELRELEKREDKNKNNRLPPVPSRAGLK